MNRNFSKNSNRLVKRNYVTDNKIEKHQLGRKIVKALGGDENGIVADLVDIGEYWVPGLGEVKTAKDAYNAYKKGDYLGAVANGLFAVPILGRTARTLSGAGKLTGRLVKAVASQKAMNAANKVNKAINETKTGQGLKFVGDWVAAPTVIGRDLINVGKELWNSEESYKNGGTLRKISIKV